MQCNHEFTANPIDSILIHLNHSIIWSDENEMYTVTIRQTRNKKTRLFFWLGRITTTNANRYRQKKNTIKQTSHPIIVSVARFSDWNLYSVDTSYAKFLRANRSQCTKMSYHVGNHHYTRDRVSISTWNKIIWLFTVIEFYSNRKCQTNARPFVWSFTYCL